MNTLSIMQSLESAIVLVRNARVNNSNVSALWNQLNRVYDYLDAQLKLELSALKAGE